MNTLGLANEDVQHRTLPTVMDVLESEIRPLLKIHGGGVDLLELSDDGVLRLEFQGACRGCALQSVTYAIGIRQRLLEVDGITDVEMKGVRLSKAALGRTAALYKGYSFRIAR
jgi:Fe-S cluster biogenesis protein NfuA